MNVKELSNELTTLLIHTVQSGKIERTRLNQSVERCLRENGLLAVALESEIEDIAQTICVELNKSDRAQICSALLNDDAVWSNYDVAVKKLILEKGGKKKYGEYKPNCLHHR